MLLFEMVGELILRTSAFHFGHRSLSSATMNGSIRHGGIHRLGFLAVLLLSAVSLKANPASERFDQLGTDITIALAILVEAICVLILLRRWRTPRLFILWLMGMHLLTYPLFLGFLWFSDGLHPAPAIAIGEGLIVLIEGGLIYLMCRFAPSAKSELPLPSVSKSLLASLAGNICSAVAFPLMMILFGLIAASIEALIGR
ncbi:MAG: hypothetical protein ABSG80_09310 [Verrucomicrobiota bacterium]